MEDNNKNNPEFYKLFKLLNSIAPYDFNGMFYSWDLVKQDKNSKNKKVVETIRYYIRHNNANITNDQINYEIIDTIFIDINIENKTNSYFFTIKGAIEFVKEIFKHELRHIKINKLFDNIPNNT